MTVTACHACFIPWDVELQTCVTCREVGCVVSHVFATWLGGFKNTPEANLESQNRIDVKRGVWFFSDQCLFIPGNTEGIIIWRGKISIVIWWSWCFCIFNGIKNVIKRLYFNTHLRKNISIYIKNLTPSCIIKRLMICTTTDKKWLQQLKNICFSSYICWAQHNYYTVDLTKYI